VPFVDRLIKIVSRNLERGGEPHQVLHTVIGGQRQRGTALLVRNGLPVEVFDTSALDGWLAHVSPTTPGA